MSQIGLGEERKFEWSSHLVTDAMNDETRNLCKFCIAWLKMLPNLVCDIVVTGQKVGPVNMWGHVSNRLRIYNNIDVLSTLMT